MTNPCPLCQSDTEVADQKVVDVVHAAVVWYKAPPAKQGNAEASLRRALGTLLNKPEVSTR